LGGVPSVTEPSRAFDEMHDSAGVRPAYAGIAAWIARHGIGALATKREEAEALFRRVGITFAVYGEGGDPERLIPFDVIPRILARGEWDRLALGLTQRVKALNAFIGDVYAGQEIVRAGLVPEALISGNECFCKPMLGFRPPAGVFTHISGIDLVRTGADEFYVLEDNCRHISGIDLVRTGADEFYVLEDNCRTPSGVSYMLENREAMLRLFPGLCSDHRLAPVGHYPEELLETLKEAAPPSCKGTPCVALLTPGHFNSAYYEHCFLADEMGVEVVEGADLFVEDDVVYMRTTAGPKRVDVLYRRVDDARRGRASGWSLTRRCRNGSRRATEEDALPHRRQPVLDGPLHRARRQHRARHAGGAAHGRPGRQPRWHA